MTDRNNYRIVNDDEKHGGDATETTTTTTTTTVATIAMRPRRDGAAAAVDGAAASHRDEAATVVNDCVGSIASEPTQKAIMRSLFSPSPRRACAYGPVQRAFVVRTRKSKQKTRAHEEPHDNGNARCIVNDNDACASVKARPAPAARPGV